MKDLLDGLGVALSAVHITDLQEGVFYATLVLSGGVEVSARPSDAIALAMRTGTTIYAEEMVLEEAGIPIADEQETEVEKFREFLDQISPDDFNTTS
jgi:bifunctional DNase/RNase